MAQEPLSCKELSFWVITGSHIQVDFPVQPHQDKHHDNQIYTPPNGFDNAAHISRCRI